MHSDDQVHIKISSDCPESDSWSRFRRQQLEPADKTGLAPFSVCISLLLVRQTGRLSSAFACSLVCISSFSYLFTSEAYLRIDGLV